MDFLENEAIESSGSDEEDFLESAKKRKEVKKKHYESDDSDEEEEDEEQIGDLINDDIEEEGNSDDEEISGKRRRQDDDEEEEDLEDDDYALLEENLGYKVDRKKKLKRVKRFEDSDNEDEVTDERQAIANELFDGDDDENEEGEIKRERTVELDPDRYNRISGSEESESEEDDFIVDDNDQPVSKPRKKKGLYRHSDEAMQQAQDIFGVEFDFDDLQNLDNEDYDDFDEENEYEEDEEGERRVVSKKKSKKRVVKKSIFELYEPSELERNHLTEKDNEIRNNDLPERFQLRSIPVTDATEEELKEEAEWIWKNAFNTYTISIQDPDADYQEDKRQPIAGRKSRSTVNKIKDALNFIRNKKNEVPFIAFYRKEYFVPDLNINDLWVIYKWDEKWCQLQQRKENIVKLIKNMQDYQIQKIINQVDEENDTSQYSRVINEKDIVRAKQCSSFEDIKDCWLHFQLYYGSDIPLMKQELQQSKKIKRRLAIESQQNAVDGEGNNEELITAPDDDEDIQNKLSSLKLAQRKNMYTVCKECKIIQLVRKFGLSPEQLGENLRDNYTRHHVNKCEDEPLKLAKELTSGRFKTPEQVIKAAVYMAACQISSDPLVRKCVRQVYFERAKLHVKPTKKGRREIDENHPCYGSKYLKNKPVIDLSKDQYLQLHIAQQTGLLEVKFTIDPINATTNRHGNSDQSMSYFEEIKQLYEIDEYSKIVQLWNDIRNDALKQALEKFLYPQLEKELKSKLVQECQEQCIKGCCKKLYDWLKIAPYRIENTQITDDEDFDTRDGIRVMGFAFMPNSDSPAFASILDSDGIVIEFIRLPYLLLKRHEFATEQERTLREQDRNKLSQFILNKKPHVIAVGSETMMARTVIGDINDIILKLMETDQFPPISVELVDNELSVVFQESKRAIAEFPSFPPLLRQSVSLARRLLDPLIEFSQLCTPDEEILCLKYHPLQQYLPNEELIESLYLEFVNRVNEVGVDLNRCILFQHTSLLVQFICGLGPRKSANLLRSLKKKQTPILESRTQLVTIFGIGAVVFINCAGFIKIDTSQLSDNNTDTYIEVLDSTRVHPETYEWARKMAVDALEYDDDQSESNPAGALEEILENPDKLKDLDLDAFAEELERQDLGYRRITLYDIRTELNCRYKDLRDSYLPPTAEVAFHLLTRETPESFCIGKMVMGKVIGITRARPQDDQYDKANPIRNEDSGLWQCPFCLRSDYGELSDVWAHFDAKECLGQAIGIRLRLDNGVLGSIETKYISDKEIKNPEERVQIGMAIHARILRINVEKFFVNLTCRTSDLLDTNNEFKPQKDFFYDNDAEKLDKETEEESKKKKKRQTYIKRIIVHPSFHNIDYAKAEKKLAEMNNGDAIIRPSSKGINHLTLSWRVYDGITAHVDITEENKANAFSIGKQLFINGEAYEDLDEILARYVHPMASLAHEIISFKYFIYADGGQKEVLETLLLDEKKKQPNKIHYFLSPSKEMPGKFALAYLPRNKVIIEFVTVTPEGIRYRKNAFRSLNALMRWFKEHFKDPIPQATPSHTITPNINQAIQKAAATMPSHLFNTLQTLQTPQSTYGSMGPPISAANHHGNARVRSSQPTPSSDTPSQTNNNWSSSNRAGGRSAGNDWRQQIESSSYNRRTPRDGNTRTPLYATPGASSMMSISPEHH